MANVLGSGQITLVDLNDAQTLTSYITSSLPHFQMYDPDTGVFSPDWTSSDLIITPELYISGTDQNVISQAHSVSWYHNNTNTPVDFSDPAYEKVLSGGTDQALKINENLLQNQDTVIFICKIVWNDEESGLYVPVKTHVEFGKVVNGERGPQGIEGPKGEDGSALYTWIRYADDDQGNGMSNSPSGKRYIGISYNQENPTESNDPLDYTWSKVEGDQGPQGPSGTDGETTYTWIKYADTDSGSGMSDSPTGKQYIGLAYNKTTPTESTTASDYAWSPLFNEQLKEDLNMTAPFPSYLEFDDRGITVTATGGDANRYVELGYRGLYVSGGAIQIDGGLKKENIEDASKWDIQGTYIDANGVYTGTLSANQINAGSLSADYITGGTISATDVNVVNLDANNITTGKMSAQYLEAKGLTVHNGTRNTFVIDSNGDVVIDGNITMRGGSITWGAGGVSAPSPAEVGAETPTGAQSKANSAEANAKLHTDVSSFGSYKIFNNPLGYSNSSSSVTGYMVIRTPIVTSYMTSMNITGFNYSENNSEIDLSLTFYAYGSGHNRRTFTSAGNYEIETVQLGKDSGGRTVIIIGTNTTSWSYPKISVDKAKIGHNTPPDSYKDGWSALITTDISAYNTISSVPGKNVNKSVGAVEAWRFGDTTEINGGSIRTNTIDANKINVNTLSALSANLGTVTAGTINGVQINSANINISEDVYIGDNLHMGNPTGAGWRFIYLSGFGAQIGASTGHMTIEAPDSLKINETSSADTSVNAGGGTTTFGGSVDINNNGRLQVSSSLRVGTNMGIGRNPSTSFALDTNDKIRVVNGNAWRHFELYRSGTMRVEMTPSGDGNQGVQMRLGGDSGKNFRFFTTESFNHHVIRMGNIALKGLNSSVTRFDVRNSVDSAFADMQCQRIQADSFGFTHGRGTEGQISTFNGGDREVVVLYSIGSSSAGGANLYLYGGNDSGLPNTARILLGTSEAVRFSPGKTTMYQALELQDGNWLTVGAVDTTATHLYNRPSSGGEVRTTALGTTGSYRPVRASSFPTSSGISTKTEIEGLSAYDAHRVLDNVDIKKYHIIGNLDEGIYDKQKIGVINEMVPADIRDEDGVDTYSMVSVLWKVVQDYKKRIEELEEIVQYL